MASRLTNEERQQWGLSRGDPRESDFLPKRDYDALRPYLENPTWKPVLHTKALTAHFYGGQGVPMPRHLGMVDPHVGRSLDGHPLRSGRDLACWLDKSGLQDVVLKHVAGGGGSQVYIVDGVDGDQFHTVDGGVLTAARVDELLRLKAGEAHGWIVQERLAPHPEVDALTGGGRSSFRVNTVAVPGGGAEVQFVIVRLGIPGAMADQVGHGGVMLPVDMKTGEMGRGLMRDGESDRWVREHPASGRVLDGAVVPQLDDVLDCARQAAEVTPELRAVGWDIVLTPDGPRMVEGNLGWSTVILQQVTGGWMKQGIVATWHDYWGSPMPDNSLAWRLKSLPVRKIRKRVWRRVHRHLLFGAFDDHP